LITREKDIDLGTLNFEVKKWLSQIAARRFLKEREATPESLFLQEIKHLQPLVSAYLPYKAACNWHIDMIQPHDLTIYEQIGGIS